MRWSMSPASPGELLRPGHGGGLGRPLNVHLGGYLNVLAAALPLMAEAGHGRILGTSTSRLGMAGRRRGRVQRRQAGRRRGDLAAPARVVPPGVTVNALDRSPTPVLVAAAPQRRAPGGPGRWPGAGCRSTPSPAPRTSGRSVRTWWVTSAGWRSGQVFFAGGPEVAVVDQPRLVEVVRTADVVSLAGVLEAVVPRLCRGRGQPGAATAGLIPGSDRSSITRHRGRSSRSVRSCAVVSERPDLDRHLYRGTRGASSPATSPNRRASSAAWLKALRATVDVSGPIDAVVVAGELAGPAAPTACRAIRRPPCACRAPPCACVLDPCGRRVRGGDRAPRTDRHADLDATAPGGRSRAQASAQLARACRSRRHGSPASHRLLTASIESSGPAEMTGGLVGVPRLPEAAALAGAELVADRAGIAVPTPDPSAPSSTAGPTSSDGWTARSARSSIFGPSLLEAR